MIIETLDKYPKVAARLFVMAQERGWVGRASSVRMSREKPAEAYLRLRTLPGEQGQVDWAHFGHLQIGRAKRALMAFVMVLSWSRQIFVRFYLNAPWMPSCTAMSRVRVMGWTAKSSTLR